MSGATRSFLSVNSSGDLRTSHAQGAVLGAKGVPRGYYSDSHKVIAVHYASDLELFYVGVNIN